jgi:hypothetical protein
MSSRTIKKSVLFRTSASTDVKRSGGYVTIAGLETIKLSNIVTISQVNYRAEVAQVVTVGATSYTPAGSTLYSVQVYDPLRTSGSYNEAPKTYSYLTPADVTTLGTAAQQREAISAGIVAAINADPTNHAIAVSLGSGNGFTVTDDGSYYPPFAQNMSNVLGPNEVKIISGYASTNISVTTAAVLPYGVGATLAALKPVVSFTTNNVVSGVLEDAPLTSTGLAAVSGQNYNGFIIEDLKVVDGITLGGRFTYQERIQTAYVDNGTGSSTTNLAGYLAFQKEIHKLMYEVYKQDDCTVAEFIDQNFIIQGPLGAVPVTTTSLVNKFLTPYGMLQHTNIGTQTIVGPTQGSTGLLTDQDVNTGDGAEYYPPVVTPNSQQFVVGKQEVIAIFGFSVTAVTGCNCLFGLRKKEAFQLDYNDYNDLAAIGFTSTSGKFSTAGILGGAATVTTTSTTTGAANGVRSTYVVKVDIDGNVTCYANGVSYPVYSAGTTPLVFAAGTILIPFFLTTQVTGTASVGVIDEMFAVENKGLITYAV